MDGCSNLRLLLLICAGGLAMGPALALADTPAKAGLPTVSTSATKPDIGSGGLSGGAATTRPNTAALPTPADDAIVRQDYAETRKMADRADTGPAGVAIWEQFLQAHPAAALADSAKKELATWKDRADKNLVLFGPQWLPREKVADRLTRADELVAKAKAAALPDEAIALLDQASVAHPFRVDIRLKKAMICYEANRPTMIAAALNEVTKLDPDNIIARNNQGVLLAGGNQPQLSSALMNLGRAVANTDNDTIFNNFDQAQALAWARKDAVNTAAAADGDRQLRQVVKRLHAAGKHLGEERWGNSWVPEATYARYAQENAELDAKISANTRTVAALRGKNDDNAAALVVAQRNRFNSWDNNLWFKYDQQIIKIQADIRDVDAQIRNLTDEAGALDSKRNVPPHAGTLVVLSEDGSPLAGPGSGGTLEKARTADKVEKSDFAGPLELAAALPKEISDPDATFAQKQVMLKDIIGKKMWARGEVVGAWRFPNPPEPATEFRLDLRYQFRPSLFIGGKEFRSCMINCRFPGSQADQLIGYKLRQTVDVQGSITSVTVSGGMFFINLTADAKSVKVSAP